MKEYLSNVHIGTCYYPDHWPRERWQQDIDNMKDMGLDVVRIAELSWAAMEPRDGEFTFGWVDDFIALAGKNGLKIVLGTPSEATPVWLRNDHPEIIRVNDFGLIHGGRGMHCHNSPTFRYYIGRMVEQMALRYGNNPTVVGWQIDNEFRAVDCYCSVCQADFRTWLREKFGTIEALNEAWGTKFWSQHYNSFEEVRLPTKDQVTISTSQVVDYKRFISNATVAFQREQIDIIKKHAKGQFVTHNALGLYPQLNMYDLARDLDVMGWDVYPNVDDDYMAHAMCHDMMRATKHAPFWMLEQKNGYFNFSDYNLAISPGLVRAWSYMDIAKGANGVLYYRYRANRYGQEQNPNGILRHDGTKRRAYYEIQTLCRELAPIAGPLGKTNVAAEVALIHNYDDMWSCQAKKQYKNFDCFRLEMDFYRALTSLGVSVDLVSPHEDFTPYKAVIAPNLMLLSEETAASLAAYVKGGGRFLCHIRAGTKNAHNAVVDTPWPGLLREMMGVTVEEFEAFSDKTGNTAFFDGQEYPVAWWADVLALDDAVCQATYVDKFYKGTPAITKNTYGKGEAVYFGAAGCYDLIRAYLKNLLTGLGIQTTNVPNGVYLSSRRGEGGRYDFVINMNHEKAQISLPQGGYDMLSGTRREGTITLDPLEVILLDMMR